MYSCDKVMMARLLPYMTYEKITLCGGIANNLREFAYSDEKIYVPDGRGYIDYTEFIKGIGIKFEEVTIEEIFQSKNTDQMMVFVPKEILENIQNLSKATQICLIYSAFEIKRISEKSIELNIADEKIQYKRTLSFSEMKKLSHVHAKPLGYAVKIIRLTDRNIKISDEKLRELLKRSLRRVLENDVREIEGTLCWSGPQMYKKSCDVIISLIEDKEQKHRNIKIFEFVSTLNAGGAAFYRKDFEKALYGEILKWKDGIKILEMLHQASGLWNGICRDLRKIQNKASSLDCEKLKRSFEEVEKMELESVCKILQRIR